jgi:dTDP-4-dehydrorhamnose reductase
MLELVMDTVIIGSSGMFGSGLVDYFDSVSHPVIEVNRTGHSLNARNEYRPFDILNDSINKLFLSLPKDSIIINASGVIKHKLDELNPKEISDAIKINTLFSRDLACGSQERNIRVIQVATDCVFSGLRGEYSESDTHDPVDIYGVTKSLGEVLAPNLTTIRTSMIGLERESNLELLNWVLSQPRGVKLQGFKNHLWNGVTTLQIAKIIRGVVENENYTGALIHLVPSDVLSKAELLAEIAKQFDRTDLVIQPVDASTMVNRRLVTDNEARNQLVWKSAGYSYPPSISSMISEYSLWIRNNIIRDKGGN